MNEQKQTQEFSLWVMPEGRTRIKLEKIMSELREVYQGPVFEPHVTLLGKINTRPENAHELVKKTRLLAETLPEYTLEIRGIECLPDFYYKCIFARINPTPEVRATNALARQAFHSLLTNNREKYEPHLSLVYGNLNPEIKRKVEGQYGKAINLDFTARKLYLYSTEGGPSKWYRAAEFDLAKNNHKAK